MDFATFQISGDVGGAARTSTRCPAQPLVARWRSSSSSSSSTPHQNQKPLHQSTSTSQGLLPRRRASSYSRRKSL